MFLSFSSSDLLLKHTHQRTNINLLARTDSRLASQCLDARVGVVHHSFSTSRQFECLRRLALLVRSSVLLIPALSFPALSFLALVVLLLLPLALRSLLDFFLFLFFLVLLDSSTSAFSLSFSGCGVVVIEFIQKVITHFQNKSKNIATTESLHPTTRQPGRVVFSRLSPLLTKLTILSTCLDLVFRWMCRNQRSADYHPTQNRCQEKRTDFTHQDRYVLVPWITVLDVPVCVGVRLCVRVVVVVVVFVRVFAFECLRSSVRSCLFS